MRTTSWPRHIQRSFTAGAVPAGRAARRRALAVCGAWWLVSALPGTSTAQLGTPGPEAREQIRALQAEKSARTPAERKLDSRLLHALRMRRGQAIAPGVASLRTGVNWDAQGHTLVDLRAEVGAELRAEIEAWGGRVVNAFPARGALRAQLPPEAIEILAERADVRSIEPAARAQLHKLDTSEGDVAHAADALRAAHGVDGAGIRVGVLSDGVDSLAAVQASGDLPAVSVLPGQAGSGSEGTALLEVVHDLAPGAELLFATAFGSQAAFAENILALAAAGADVIVDDIFYSTEAVLQDDDLAEAVDSVSVAGVLYFSAAGNGGSLAKGTAGVWEGDFVDSGISFRRKPAHDFGGGTTRNRITQDSPFWYTLQWSDAQGSSGNDYDLYLLSPGGSQVVAASTNLQNGNDDPFELIDSRSSDDTDRELLVVRSRGTARFLHLDANRGRLERATAGQTGGHSAAREAFSIAAVRASQAGGAGGAFDGSEPVESFSSDGPRRVFFLADGTPLTPGDFSATGGELRQKPDFAAADCVSTATPGFATFCGTSAAAPHAAAIAALLLELGGGDVTAADVGAALEASAFDIEAPGVDDNAGFGLLDAAAAADLIAVPEPPAAASLAACAALLAGLCAVRRRPLRRPGA
ncbi:MAG: S8 family serine peptidase, partial [Myxococcales bacterium]|nr:S8 family serine peptidase [Myxococcales bacterium]